MTRIKRLASVALLLFSIFYFLPSAFSEAAKATELNNLAVQEAQAGRFEKASALLRQALRFEPNDVLAHRNLSGILTDWAIQLHQQAKVDQATELLQEAIRHDPDNGRALVFLGDLYYLTHGNLEGAVRMWKQAHGKTPADVWRKVAQRLSQAERDLKIERSFTGTKSAHFRIRFEESRGAEIASRLEKLLELEYGRLAKLMGEGPLSLSVIVYTDRDFERLVGRQDWIVGMYDGRIRLRLVEIEAGRGRATIAHELSHAFLWKAYGSGIPTWIHEGFAQVQEPEQPLVPRQKAILESLKNRTAWVPLAWLDRRFEQPSNLEDIERAYVESRWVVALLIERHGMERFKRFLEKMVGGEPIERAFDQIFAPARWYKINQGNFE